VIECWPRCLSIPKTRWLFRTDRLQWIAAPVPGIESLIHIYQTGRNPEIERAHRNNALDILAGPNHVEQFKMLQDGLRLLELLRILCDRLEKGNASLTIVIPSVRRALTAYRALYPE
jgi:hypothetical protein